MLALFTILVSLTMTWFSENMLIFTRSMHGFMSNLIKKSWKDSIIYIVNSNLPFKISLISSAVTFPVGGHKTKWPDRALLSRMISNHCLQTNTALFCLDSKSRYPRINLKISGDNILYHWATLSKCYQVTISFRMFFFHTKEIFYWMHQFLLIRSNFLKVVPWDFQVVIQDERKALWKIKTKKVRPFFFSYTEFSRIYQYVFTIILSFSTHMP